MWCCLVIRKKMKPFLDLSIGYLNIGGINDVVNGCKLKQLNDYLNCDIEILSETWGRCNHYEELEEYNLLIKNESQKNNLNKKGRSSGGMIVYYKKYLVLLNMIKVVKETSNYIWIELKKGLFHSITKNLKVCIIYNPPMQSKYYKPNLLEEIGVDILDVCKDESPIMITGDMNARTSNLLDYTLTNKNEIVNSLIEENHPKIGRQNCDLKVNPEGLKLIDLCKSFDLMILNGRSSGDYWGNFTHYNINKGASTVDLAIVSCKIFDNIKSFRVMPQLDMTDHCKIITQIGNTCLTPISSIIEEENYKWLKLPNKYKWDDKYAKVFKETLNSKKLESIIVEAEQRLRAGLIESTGIKIQDIFQVTADSCLKTNNNINQRSTKNKNRIKKNKKWFDLECKTIKNRVKIAANKKHHRPLNEDLRLEHKNTLKLYKRMCRYKQIEFWKAENKKINEEDANFWDVWKILGENENRSEHIEANGETWETYFSNLYKRHKEKETDRLENVIINENNNALNSQFTLKELKDTIKSIKNKKATGYDSICNEFLKQSSERILKLLLNFLNLALSKGLITSKWCLDIINPIHKEGSKSNPDNYRGICIMNSLLKLLCTMMNNRLNEYCEQNNLINIGQIGFKKGCRTSDHLLTLKSIINKYVYDKRTKLYTCFVDFKKAFDSIWQKALFHKLEVNNINGNFLNLLKDIYKKSKCTIKINNKLTNIFNHEKGVRQGDPLSPTLFNIYINDLFAKIDEVNDDFVTLNEIDKISALMFADDLILISTSKEGLQNSLNALGIYAEKWKLEINYKKTKCVTFTKSNHKEVHEFNINRQKIDNTNEYKYLGIKINTKGSFLPALGDLSCKAKRAIYSMNSKINIRFLSIKTLIRLFDSLICPILLYGSEIWEPFLNENNDKWDNNEIEKVHTQFLKRIIGVNRSTSNAMVRGDLGRYSLQSRVTLRNIKYLNQVKEKSEKTLVKQAYTYEHSKSSNRVTIENSVLKFKDILKETLNKDIDVCKLSHLKLKSHIGLVYCESWEYKLLNSTKADTYKLFKNIPKFEKILIT